MHRSADEPPVVPELPAGVVTFLMTAVESSTRLWREAAEAEATAVMARQAELIAAAVARHGGVHPADQGEGDSTPTAAARSRCCGLASIRRTSRKAPGCRWPTRPRWPAAVAD
jgi:class 3 adenylate cyclase